MAVGTQTLASYTYNVRTGAVETMTYGNGDSVEYVYDSLDRLSEVKYNGSVRLRYSYTGEGRLYKIEDLFLNTSDVYTYDSLGRLIYTAEEGGVYQSYGYDTANRLTSLIWGGSWIPVRTQTYAYNARGLLASTAYSNGTNQTYTYDALGRVTGITGTKSSISYGYAAPGGSAVGTTTTLVSDLTVTNSGGTTLLDLNYTYDSMGRIASDGTYTYTYDALGQLTTVKNAAGTTVASYTYDGAGNILSATENGTTSTYTYGNTNWPDLLTAYNGTAITYDEIGNPLSYRGYTMTWENGRQLASMSGNGKSISFTYDADGLRTSKTVDGTTTEYIYNGTQLVGQKSGQTILEFLYDAAGKPYAVLHSTNGGSSYTTYYYLLNLQGDIVGMINASGTVIVRYTYDPWGKVTAVTNGSGAAITSATHFANINPLRYRGYVYDNETQLYYLQSRYYDPAMGRFLNADAFVSTGQGLLGFNMYAYCHNNPVIFVDFSGYIITLAGDASDEEIEEYERALAYLQNSETACLLIELLDESSVVFTVIPVNNNKMVYDSSTNYIYFDINSGLAIRDGSSVQSAALGLAHEMGHAAQNLQGLYYMSEEESEAANLEMYETPIAKELGEPVRRDYHDARGTMNMANSIHFKTISAQTRPIWHYIFFWNWGKPRHLSIDHNLEG